ncbi:hypothetical protein [Streptomyces neyagawaensis]|uniref:hypothetical protein n=1 Tax=Streptomyces neyagawaensis TaxID=42238 RepID=UPI000A4DEB9C|nr:hypothetical protein [Streptomyces neyagawaensis]MCL6734076.1 hypothetical protein [Streptomyces neyagawaensis]MDE1681008.1 hypothetical protein [Streptomyces neyagawaensis]
MSVARRASSTARRSLLTATAAGTLLAALWFVPSANATQEAPDIRQETTTTTDSGGTTVSGSAEDEESAGRTTQLADTGSPNTTPYIVGGTLFLGLGAGFVAYSVRQGRLEAY